MNQKFNTLNSIKVAHIITRMIIGGAQENTLYTVLELQKDTNYDVSLITGIEIGPEGRLNLDFVKNLIFAPFLVRKINPIKDFICLLKLYKLFKKNKYDVIHTHSSKAGVIARFAAKLANIPVIIHTIHGLAFHEYQNAISNFIYIILEKICAFFTDKIIVVADEMRNKSLNYNIGNTYQYKTIFSGMLLDDFLNSKHHRLTIRNKLNIDNNKIVIGTVARLFSLKGHEFLLSIAKDLINFNPDIIFLWVGDGILYEKYKLEIDNLKLTKHFIFTGLVEPNDIPKLLSGMDILVHTSLREGLARVLPQAMAAQIPVISFDIDGAKDIIDNNISGFLVKPKDTVDLKNKIIQLLNSIELKDKFIQNGLKKIDPYFRHDYMVLEIKKVYQEFL